MIKCKPTGGPVCDKVLGSIFSFKTCPPSGLGPLHTLYNVSELAPLLQGYATLSCSSLRLVSIDLVLIFNGQMCLSIV